jgi:Raf kinase inhibitor-like YbhB/YbcL family protein
MTLKCTSYAHEALIPVRFVHSSVDGGKNVSPGFTWANPLSTAKSFALSIIDPHPVAKNWVHWFVIDIPFNERSIPEGASRTHALPRGAKELLNTGGQLGYEGPYPPPGSGLHPYVATVYALNVSSLNLPTETNLRQFLRAIEGKVIEEATVAGKFER